MKNRLPCGFTLVEILTVILIVAVVAALAFPLVASVRQRALQAKSINNLRQMAPALLSYVSDQGGKLPEGAFGPTLGGTKMKFWFNALDYYMGGNDYTADGMALGVRPKWQNDPAKVFAKPIMYLNCGVGVGYGWNHSYFGYRADYYPEKLGWGSRLVEVEAPSKTIIIGTSIDDVEASDVAKHVLIYPNISNAAKRYNGGGLYLFVDGHVEWLTPEIACANDQYLFKKKK